MPTNLEQVRDHLAHAIVTKQDVPQSDENESTFPPIAVARIP